MDDALDDGFNPLSTWQAATTSKGITATKSQIVSKKYFDRKIIPQSSTSTRNLADFGVFVGKSFHIGWGLHGKFCAPTAGNSVIIQNAFERRSDEDIEKDYILGQLKLHYSHSFPIEEEASTKNTPRLKLQCSRSLDHLQNLTRQYKEICQNYISQSELDNSSNIQSRSAESDIWDLVNVLFSLVAAEEDPLADDESDFSDQGNLMSLSDMQRRAAFSTWLKHRTYDSAEKQIDGMKDDPSRDYEKILASLSCHDLPGAVLAASASGNPRLSTLIATAGTMTNVVNNVNDQQKIWREEGYSNYIDGELSKIYDLLGGNVDNAMHIVSNDWKRALGLHLWYATPKTASITAALESYLISVEEGKAPYPSPWHSSVPYKGAPNPTDSAFELIKMFCQSEEWQSVDEKKAAATESLADLLSPLGVTPDVQYASFFWHLYCVLESIGVIQGDLTEDARTAVSRTITTYISQLESIGGFSHWAIYVALHIQDTVLRDAVVKDLLTRYCEEWQNDDQVVAFLVEKLGIPCQILEEAKAIFALTQNNHESLLESLMDAEDWTAAHSTLKRIIAPKWFLAKDTSGDKYALHEDLLGALEDLEQYKEYIDPQSWRIGGGMYLSFFRLKDKMLHMDQISEEDISEIEELQNVLDDAYDKANESKEGNLEKAAYAIMAREISSVEGSLPSISQGTLALRYSNIQSNIQAIAHALACDLS